MQRYFVELAYRGTAYHGWQKQPGAVTVQETIEAALSTLLNQPIEVLGCGRTDAGVHASQFYLHFDGPDQLAENLLSRINKFLPKDIAIFRFLPVASEAHARFDATQRSYEYHLTFRKNPFTMTTAYYFPMRRQLQVEALQKAADILLAHQSFFPFCK
ncbi:MAG: tRNA pseudouridine synthase A, partial [Bacteroidota bacterium]